MSATHRAPRVLLSGVVLAQPMGGVRRHNAQLLPRVAQALRAGGGELCILAPSEGLPFAVPEARIEAGSVHATSPIRRAMGEGRALRQLLDEAKQAGNPFDWVHTAHFPVPRGLGRMSVTIHDLRSLTLEHTPLSRRLMSRGILGSAFTRAELVFTVSEDVRSQLQQVFRVQPHKIRCLPNAADHISVLPRCDRPDSPLLHVGHLEPRKNLELLLEALALDTGLPQLVLAGADKPGEGARLLRRAHELGIEDRVEWIGSFDDADLPALYSRAACVVIPSRLEGFCIPVLEAQRAGVPVAVARAGALLETAGSDTPSFDPDSPAECVAAIRQALDYPAAALENAALRASKTSWQTSADAWVSAWSEAIS
ncbi:MAG: glycosyltransferase involved in cell wall biosynthesis [Planctomycetota bacterium]|jgi:glycosyltransferase involved in cell wall biosynthesis